MSNEKNYEVQGKRLGGDWCTAEYYETLDEAREIAHQIAKRGFAARAVNLKGEGK